VLGGSLGARQLDRTVSGAIEELGDRELQLLVAAGPAHVGEIAALPGGVSVRVFGFIERMDLALALADIAVARAGSGTIAELAACGVASILVPYPHATENHQEANAREIEEAGGAEVVLEEQLTPGALVARLDGLLGDEARRRSMREAMLRWARPEADRAIADLVQACAA
jgi:UDP-N-acetylglucosamine--N-acetylmuramyl-(pentapeptide) pyrophosphoryl-undecaprenol N-acetylglucosamine transferase